LGSQRPPTPARKVVWMLMVLRCPWFRAAGGSAAVRVDARALAGGHAAADGHGVLLSCRWSAVGIDGGSVSRGDRGLRLHPPPPPLGSMAPPPSPPARTRVVVFIRPLLRWGPSRRRSRRRRGCGSSCSSRSSAVGIDVPAVTGAELSPGGHGAPPPCGSHPAPSPARTCVLVLIVFLCSKSVGSAAAVRVEPRPVAGAHAAVDARHVLLRLARQPSGSMVIPAPARVPLWFFMVRLLASGAAVGVDEPALAGVQPRFRLHGCLLSRRGGRCRRRRRRELRCGSSSCALVDVYAPVAARLLRGVRLPVGIDAGRVSGADPGAGVHRSLLSGVAGSAFGVDGPPAAGAGVRDGDHRPLLSVWRRLSRSGRSRCLRPRESL
jgi:hypothetical protein